MRRLPAVLLFATTLLAGCEMLGIESPETIATRREAEGRAIGGACRHAARAIEDCFAINRKADKAAVFAGWREMNDYMRENNIAPLEPQVTAQASGSTPSAEPEPAASKAPASKTPANKMQKARSKES